ncbi:MAG: DUF3786 domain-containing protein [Dehalococcoidia bacterium]|nr:DUF3786 domain-containing protein [Dehalococcoidia bacterium]MDH4368008.1 DUF3786 domain-containing protein [Dehalococcoidia bacterium]
MEVRRSSSNSPWERGFDVSYKFACEKLAAISDIREQCRRSGARCMGRNEIVVDYLNQPYHIVLPECRILLENNDREIPLRDKILILHYFTGAKGTPATGKSIAYKQLQGGASYFPAFSQRAIGPLVKNFGNSPELLRRAAAKLGGREANYGDVSVTIDAFDHVPITFVLWKGDEEVASNGNILFDANISDYLATEDVTVLCETIIWKLVRDIPAC